MSSSEDENDDDDDDEGLRSADDGEVRERMCINDKRGRLEPTVSTEKGDEGDDPISLSMAEEGINGKISSGDQAATVDDDDNEEATDLTLRARIFAPPSSSDGANKGFDSVEVVADAAVDDADAEKDDAEDAVDDDDSEAGRSFSCRSFLVCAFGA